MFASWALLEVLLGSSLGVFGCLLGRLEGMSGCLRALLGRVGDVFSCLGGLWGPYEPIVRLWEKPQESCDDTREPPENTQRCCELAIISIEDSELLKA